MDARDLRDLEEIVFIRMWHRYADEHNIDWFFVPNADLRKMEMRREFHGMLPKIKYFRVRKLNKIISDLDKIEQEEKGAETEDPNAFIWTY